VIQFDYEGEAGPYNLETRGRKRRRRIAAH
jgi:hypothetical protein